MINDFRISPNFLLREFECPCCRTVSLNAGFIDKLQKLREHRGRIVITPNGGGYRCDAYQLALHYARAELLHQKYVQPKIAAHSLGQAADITIFNDDEMVPVMNADIPFLKSLGFTGIGISVKGWAHLDDAHDPFQTWTYSY